MTITKSMKYLSFVMVAALAFLASAGYVKAEEATVNTDTSASVNSPAADMRFNADMKADLRLRRESSATQLKTKREELRKEMEVKRTEFRAEVGEMRDEAQKARSEFRAEVRGKIAIAFARITENLAQIAERINSRIEKLKAEGVDVSVSEEAMIKAETSLGNAVDFAAEVKAKIDANASVEEIRAVAIEAKNALKEAHQYLRQAVSELKSKMAEVNAARKMEVKSITDVNVTGEVSQ